MKPADHESKSRVDSEAWLRGILSASNDAESQRARLLAGIAVSQVWLAGLLRDPLPEGFVERVRMRVAEEAAAIASQAGRNRGIPRYRFAAGVLAAAAALIFAILPDRSASSEYAAVTASVALTLYRDDELGEMVAALKDELDELVMAFGIDDSAATFENTLDEFSDWLAEMEDDWS